MDSKLPVGQYPFLALGEQPSFISSYTTMNLIENGQTNIATRSDLSDWVGAPILLRDTFNEAGRIGEDKVVADHLDFTKRMYDVLRDTEGLEPTGDYVPLGPSNEKTRICCLLDLNKNSYPLRQAANLYAGFAYDSIDIVLSLSDTKGIAGAVAVGCYPFVPFSDTGFDQEIGYHKLNEMTLQNLVNTSPECQLVTFSEAQDVRFSIPWQYPFPYLPMSALMYSQDSNVNQPPPGAPVFFFHVLSANYVSTITQPARLRVFATFNNLRFFGPGVVISGEGRPSARSVSLQSQSGLEPAAAFAVAAVTDAVVTTGSEILSSVFSSSQESEAGEDYKAGTYEAPTSVQLSYAGDTTAVGPPPTSPIFHKNLETTQKHPLSVYLKRPQLIFKGKVNDEESTFYANPTFPTGWRNGANQLCNYFRWFSQGAQYWKGTINLHAVILGHPMVEVGYKMMISYPPDKINLQPDVGTASMLNGVCNGVTHIVIPMPTLNPLDHFPVVDTLLSSDAIVQVQKASGSQLHAKFSIVSTMLDRIPEIDVLYFITAGDDFSFLQYNPIGLGEVDNPPQEARSVPLEAQVGLLPPDVTFETRARVQESTDTLMAITCVEDYFKVWSRSLPYASYQENEEPDPRLDVAASAWWFPLNDSGAARTLDVNNSWWSTNDFLSFYSSQFLLFRGSIAWKILCVAPDRDYAYVALDVPNPSYRQLGHSPFTYYPGQLPPSANFGYGCVVTPTDKQPVLDLTIPFRSGLAWNLTNPQVMTNSVLSWVLPDGALVNKISHNVILHQEEGDLQDALYRKAGADYNLRVECMLPPPTLWLAKGYNWV